VFAAKKHIRESVVDAEYRVGWPVSEDGKREIAIRTGGITVKLHAWRSTCKRAKI